MITDDWTWAKFQVRCHIVCDSHGSPIPMDNHAIHALEIFTILITVTRILENSKFQV